MQRIGIAASKMAKGNIWLYHLALLAVTLLFALFAFLVCSFVVAVAIFLVSLILQFFLPAVDQKAWLGVLRTCLLLLAGVIGIIALVAIIQNIKLKK